MRNTLVRAHGWLHHVAHRVARFVRAPDSVWAQVDVQKPLRDFALIAALGGLIGGIGYALHTSAWGLIAYPLASLSAWVLASAMILLLFDAGARLGEPVQGKPRLTLNHMLRYTCYLNIVDALAILPRVGLVLVLIGKVFYTFLLLRYLRVARDEYAFVVGLLAQMGGHALGWWLMAAINHG